MGGPQPPGVETRQVLPPDSDEMSGLVTLWLSGLAPETRWRDPKNAAAAVRQSWKGEGPARRVDAGRQR